MISRCVQSAVEARHEATHWSRRSFGAMYERVRVGSDDLEGMRKRISSQPQRESASANQGWRELEALAQVEVTSEDAAQPLESALLPGGTAGWRAESPGEQTVRLLFDMPQRQQR